jgi:hypothetical protein
VIGALNPWVARGRLLSRSGVAGGYRIRVSACSRTCSRARINGYPLPLCCAVDGGEGDEEQVVELSGAVLHAVEKSHQVRLRPVAQLGLSAAQGSFGLATFIPSEVRANG